MHYRNGREAKNGDKVIQITFDGKITAGVLYDALGLATLDTAARRRANRRTTWWRWRARA